MSEFCARWIVYSFRLFALRRRSRCVNSAFPNKKIPNKKICPQNRSLFMINKFESKCYVCKNSTFQVNRKKNNGIGRRRQLEQPRRHFWHHLMRRTTQQTLLAINLASQQKTTKLYFSSQVRKQHKLSAVPFKPLRCCLRNDKLENCHVWKFCKDLFLNLSVIWSVSQIVLLMVSSLMLLRSLRVYILKQLLKQLFFQSRWIVALGIFTSPLSRLGKYLATVHFDFKE